MTVVIAVAYILGNMLLLYRLLYAVVATWTVCHVLKQQYGIARGMCQLSESVFKLSLTLSVAAGVAIYISIFLRNSLTEDQIVWIKLVAALGCLLLVVAAFVYQHLVTTSFGLWFYWSNVFLVLASFYLFLQ